MFDSADFFINSDYSDEEGIFSAVAVEDSFFRYSVRERRSRAEWQEFLYQIIDFRRLSVYVSDVYVSEVRSDFQGYKEVFEGSDGEYWRISIFDEYNFLVKNNIWEFADLFSGRKFIICKWVFKIKLKADGFIVRYKLRFVVRGFSQISGIDYGDTFLSVVKLFSVRILFAMVV